MFWQRKSNRRVFVYYWCRATGKQKALSRDLTRHLDPLTDSEIDLWLKNQSDLTKLPLRIEPLPEDHKMVAEVFRFTSYLKEDLKRHPYTAKAHEDNLIRIALPFFFHIQNIESIDQIKVHSSKLREFLKKERYSQTRIKNIQMSLRMFWTWLCEENIAEGTIFLRKGPSENKSIPLKRTPSPDEILTWIAPTDELRLLLLVGYFFSLRPQEIFALKPIDFLWGPKVETLEAANVMKRAKLYSEFCVRIRFQRSRSIGITEPKADSRGIVACFHEKAALIIIELIRNRPSHELLFPYGNDWYYKLWRRMGYPDLSLKDCRRASLYWLGHYTCLEITALKNHARHKDIATTSLYTRRPNEDDYIFESLIRREDNQGKS